MILKSKKARKPYFSIITVTKNSELTILETILAIKGQTFKDFEFIVIDGESSDRTMEILKTNIDLIDILISEKDEGLYFAMNKGISLAKGEYIGIINSDDYYELNALELVKNLSMELDKPSVIYSPMRVLGSEKIVDISHKELEKRMIPHPSCFVPKEFYSKFGMFDTSFRIAADYELMLRFWSAGSAFVKVPTPLVNYREGGYSSKNARKSILETLIIQQKYNNTSVLLIYPHYAFISFKSLLKRIALVFSSTKRI